MGDFIIIGILMLIVYELTILNNNIKVLAEYIIKNIKRGSK